jgi:hypothetical protein
MKNDPRIIENCKFGKCSKCGCDLTGKTAFYWPNGKRAYCENYGEEDFRKCQSACLYEDTGVTF